MTNFLLFLSGAGVGVAVSVLWWRGQSATLRTRAETAEQRLESQSTEIIDLREGRADLVAEVAKAQAAVEAERRAFEQAREQLADQFGSLSAKALEQNNRQFLDLAQSTFDKVQSAAKTDFDTRTKSIEQIVSPVKDTLEKMDQQMHQLELARTDAQSTLVEHLKSMSTSQEKLQSETASLVTALRTPHVRGQWGEMQLRRTVEVAGMLRHCDFDEQVTVVTEGKMSRPDMVVRIAGGKQIVVDAKVPLLSYLDAMKTDDVDLRSDHMDVHVTHLRTHIDSLGSKTYWEQFDNSPDFVVLFVPGESILAAALEKSPDLIEYGLRLNVMLASPTSLITMLRSIAYGWKQDALAENAREICKVGTDLYNRICTMGKRMTGVGKALDKAVDSYNSQIGSMERMVLPSARKLASLEISSEEIAPPMPIEKQARPIQAADMTRLIPVDDEDDAAAS